MEDVIKYLHEKLLSLPIEQHLSVVNEMKKLTAERLTLLCEQADKSKVTYTDIFGK